MRDLRNGSVIKNVTRSSARKLWHYAITAKESGALNPAHVTWLGDVGLWRRTHKGGTTRYDLVRRADGELHVYYGVTEDGIHGAWRRLIEAQQAVSAPVATEAAESAPISGQPATAPEEEPGAMLPLPAPVAMLATEPGIAAVAPPDSAAGEFAPETLDQTEGEAETPAAPAPRRRGRGVSRDKPAAKNKAAPAARSTRKSTKSSAASKPVRTRSKRSPESAA
jgi:hypothetical protein